MTYKMIQFNPLNGQLIVDVEGQHFNVDVPIEAVSYTHLYVLFSNRSCNR